MDNIYKIRVNKLAEKSKTPEEERGLDIEDKDREVIRD